MNDYKQYYVNYNAQQFGPMSWDELQRRGYPPDALVWSDGMANWQALKTIMPQAPSPPPYYGNQQANVNVSYAGDVYANFGLRLGAYIIDSIIIIIVGGMFGAIFGALFARMAYTNPDLLIGLIYLFNIIIVSLYYALFESSEYQATPGKMLLKIKVVDINHERIDVPKAFGRFFGKILSGIILFIGFLMVLWTDKRQALHDQLANTLVIKADKPQINY